MDKVSYSNISLFETKVMAKVTPTLIQVPWMRTIESAIMTSFIKKVT